MWWRLNINGCGRTQAPLLPYSWLDEWRWWTLFLFFLDAKQQHRQQRIAHPQSHSINSNYTRSKQLKTNAVPVESAFLGARQDCSSWAPNCAAGPVNHFLVNGNTKYNVTKHGGNDKSQSLAATQFKSIGHILNGLHRGRANLKTRSLNYL